MENGVKLTYGAISINLIIAGIMYVILFGEYISLGQLIILWPLHLGIGIFALYLSGHVVGNKMEYLIVQRKWNSILTGIVGLLIILLIGVLSGSSVGFLPEAISHIKSGNGLKDYLFDYYRLPLYWIFLFGHIPTIIAGGITGYLIKKSY